ncbi:Gfo/Idh/MocA family protein [Actinopolymorpha singaporensis]|uniref:Oxidoreductase family, C-terminal alpha/beta domain n=1 Tax=Actinopolymorpha singaporensis TaxID=117157 RepID=A0A1H1R2K3_9ACTN|nr:Gfo/Idh/MocA family oxidoreductase [Actinopolymorpha singaporensis]SDS29860.1 Oxidoreductase family, C-terminal alpha/beta domain [Actinopolymorpha singaporensis]
MSAHQPRIGVVGTGSIGRAHLNAYRRAGVDPVAVADVDPAAVEAVAAEFGATAYTDIAAMLADGDLDAISVCTPPSTHQALTVRALEAKVAVLCEKPMARTLDECELMIKAAHVNRTVLTVGFCHRFQPEIEAIKAAIAEGRIGTVLTFRNRFSGPLDGVESSWFSQPAISGGGVLMDTCVHSVDLFRYLLGEVDQVRALTATTATSRGPALEVEDSAVLSLQSADGVLGVIEASWRTAPGEAVVTVSGTHGRLQLDYATMRLTEVAVDGTESVVEVTGEDRFTRQARHFLSCVAGTEQPRVTPADGARAIAVLAEATASAGARG